MRQLRPQRDPQRGLSARALASPMVGKVARAVWGLVRLSATAQVLDRIEDGSGSSVQ